MSSLIPFSDHHVQLDFIFCPSCPAWFYFCTSCPAWLYVLSPHIMPSQGAQTILGTTPCQPLSSLSSQSQPKNLFPCILACTPTHKIFHEYHNTHPHPAHDGLTHTAGQINDSNHMREIKKSAYSDRKSEYVVAFSWSPANAQGVQITWRWYVVNSPSDMKCTII